MRSVEEVAILIIEILTAQPNQKQFNAIIQVINAFREEMGK